MTGVKPLNNRLAPTAHIGLLHIEQGLYLLNWHVADSIISNPKTVASVKP